jgi:two-component system, chemotaxis family, sensor kinase CheA
MSQQSDERNAEMRDLFLQSAQELLQSLNEQGLQLEANAGDSEVARDIRRTVHTLKGDAAAVGLRELSELAHELEDVLSPATVASNGASLAQVVLSAADMFDAMLAAYRAGMEPPSGDPLRALIWKLAQQAETVAVSPVVRPVFAWSEYEQLAMAAAARRGLRVLQLAISLADDCPMRAAGAAVVRKTLLEAGEILATMPEESQWANTDKLEFAYATMLDETSVATRCQVPGIVGGVVVQEYKPAEPAAVSKAPIKSPKLGADNVLRVEAARIDTILDLVGELVIAKSMLHQMVNDFARRYPRDPMRARLADVAGFQAQILAGLQRAAMKVRMVPVEQLFRRFPRLVRDLARRCGREVVVEMSGQDTDLDKGLLDALAEPLAHLVRNAVDHGIETGAERAAAGKPATGCIRMNAYNHANQIVVEISDDGRGIDTLRVLARAVARGLLTQEQAARLTPEEATELIFEPGFSTAEQVTEVSGRGVGLDAVKAAVQKLKGSISLDTHPGQGTTFRIKLPLTLAILRGMLFRVHERLYAVPLDHVLEITRASEADITRVDNREVLQLRNDILTIVRLNRLDAAGASLPSGKVFVLVINEGARKYGLVVDRLVGEEELVIKPLDENIVASDLVSGASVLGDGSVAMILNLSELVRRFATAALPKPPLGATPPKSWGATA